MKKSPLLSQNLRLLREIKNLSRDALGNELGVTGDQIYTYEERGTEPKPLIMQRICDRFGLTEQQLRAVKITEKNYPQLRKGDNILEDAAAKYQQMPTDKNDVSMVAIANLTESNRLMAESQISLARSHEELVIMLKNTTGGLSKETIEAVGAKLLALQEFVIEQSLKKQAFHSKEEARAALNIKTVEILKKK